MTTRCWIGVVVATAGAGLDALANLETAGRVSTAAVPSAAALMAAFGSLVTLEGPFVGLAADISQYAERTDGT